MNYITTDKGDTVPAVGAPGSPIRAGIEHPMKIETINEEMEDLQEAIDYLTGLGITSKLETRSILSHTKFKDAKVGYVVFDEMAGEILLETDYESEAREKAYNHQCVLVLNGKVIKDYSCDW